MMCLAVKLMHLAVRLVCSEVVRCLTVRCDVFCSEVVTCLAVNLMCLAVRLCDVLCVVERF